MSILADEEEVLEWLIFHQNSVHDDVKIDAVNPDELTILVNNVDNLMVIFHDKNKRSLKVKLMLRK